MTGRWGQRLNGLREDNVEESSEVEGDRDERVRGCWLGVLHTALCFHVLGFGCSKYPVGRCQDGDETGANSPSMAQLLLLRGVPCPQISDTDRLLRTSKIQP